MNDYTIAILHAKAVRLKGEGFEPGEWKNKNFIKILSAKLPPILSSFSHI